MPRPSADLTAGEIWTAVAVRLGSDEATAGRTGTDLDTRYGEPHRRYHTGGHARSVATRAQAFAATLRLDASERDPLVAAACAHDVVYDARPGDDERASAAWAVDSLTSGGVAPAAADRVAELILTTIAHDAPDGDPAADILLDADLAVLASHAGEYAAYVDGVRAEYVHVCDADWVTGRAAVLRAFLERPRIFRTSWAAEAWDEHARLNMTTELDLLCATEPA